MRTWVLALFLVFKAAGQPGTTVPRPDDAVIRVDVREVLVPVIVTDAKGHHVTALKSSDFRIEEDGVPQDVTAFSTNSSPSPELLALLTNEIRGQAQRPTSASPSLPHTFVICIDTLHTSFANTTAIRDALTRLLEKEKPNGTQFSVVAIGRKLQVVQTVTTDPAAAVARLRGGSFRNVMSGDEASLASELNDLKNSMYDFCRRCPACGAGANSATCATQVQSLKLTLDGQAERWGSFTKQMLAQLKAVVEELTKLSSTRTLVLVSDGFSLQPARDFYSVAAAFLPAARQFKTSGPDDLEAEVQAITRAALAGNVRIYSLASNGNSQPSFSAGGSMDASSPSDRSAPSVIRHVPSANRGGGLLSDMDREASANVFQNSSALSQLAQTTGGEFLHGSNDTLKQFQSILADGREYYMLAYVPKNSAQDGAFRSIAVQVKGGKNLQVRAKAGYWPKTPQAN